MVTSPTDAIPVNLITGFLGSGKTTFLNYLLQQPSAANSGVIINEIGDIGIDHDLVETQGDDFIMLSGGCLCCALRGSIEETIQTLIAKHDRSIGRIYIETSGMADPTPIAHSLMASPILAGWTYLGEILNVFDGQLGQRNVRRFAEAQRQLAAADAILLTKALPGDGTALEHARAFISEFNDRAPVFMEADNAINAILKEKAPELIAPARPTGGDDIAHGAAPASETAAHVGTAYATASLRFPGTLGSESVEAWLEDLFAVYGSRILRVKGLLRISGYAEPAVLQAVQYLLAPPRFLDDWPDADRQNRLVIIGEQVDKTLLEHALYTLAAAAEQA